MGQTKKMHISEKEIKGEIIHYRLLYTIGALFSAITPLFILTQLKLQYMHGTMREKKKKLQRGLDTVTS